MAHARKFQKVKACDMADDLAGARFPCPICGGRMELVYDRDHQKVMVCVECHSGLTIPDSAHEVKRLKRERQGGDPQK